MRRLFRRRFPEFQAAYEQRYAPTFGRFRLPLIVRAASAFRVCGDWNQGIARIRCPKCGFDRFRPFSCKSYLLCPSCAQKRTLLLSEYLSEHLLLDLPHRQFVYTIPKALRVLLRYDRRLFGLISRLIFSLLSEFYSAAAGKPISSAAILAYQT